MTSSTQLYPRKASHHQHTLCITSKKQYFTLALHAISGPSTTIPGFDAMNPGPPEMYYQQPMSAGQQHPPPTATSGALAHYPPPQGQPPLLHPGQGHSQPHTPYGQYGYTNGLTSPPAAMPMSNSMPGGHSVLPLPGPTPQQSAVNYQYDSTGQNPPPGMKPRVTATLWEDEGSLCFQVEARGICVARREGRSSLALSI